MIRSCPAVYFPLSARRARFSAACLIPPPASSLITPAIFHNSAVVVAAALRSGSVNAIRPGQPALPAGRRQQAQPVRQPATCRHTGHRHKSSQLTGIPGIFQPVHFAVSDSDSSDDSEASLIPRSSSFSRVSRLSGPPNESLICPPCCSMIREGILTTGKLSDNIRELCGQCAHGSLILSD